MSFFNIFRKDSDKDRSSRLSNREQLKRLKQIIKLQTRIIMELPEIKEALRTAVAGIKVANEGLVRIIADEDRILAKVKELEDQVAGNSDPELVEIVSELKGLVEGQVTQIADIDNKIPETTNPPV